MTNTKTTFRYSEYSDEGGECDCCGSYFGEGKIVYVNDEVVWEYYSDGHMGGTCSDDSIATSVINTWANNTIASNKELSSENARLEWNIQYPGNGIAGTIESWDEYHSTSRECFDLVVERIIDRCSIDKMPYDQLLQLKMISLWIEDENREQIDVVILNEGIINDE